MRNKQKGFSLVEGLLIFVIVGVLVGTGWYVWQSNKKTDKTLNDTGNSHVVPSKKVAEKKVETKYLVIKEWGVQLPLSNSISDAYYVISSGSHNTDGQPNTMWLGLKSLDDKGCIAAQANSGGSYPIGAILKVLPDEMDPVSGRPYQELDRDGVLIEGYYYAYHSGIQGNSDSRCIAKANVTNADAIDTAFRAAGRGIIKK
jgi:type II secretory pathway pseudopilin PulG